MNRAARSALVLATALVLVVALGFALVAWRAHRRLSGRPDEILAAASASIGLPVEADAVGVTWWPPGLVVHGPRIPDESPLGPGTLAHADEVRLVVRAGSLLAGDVVVRRIDLVAPVVRAVRGVDGGWNLGGGAPVADEADVRGDARGAFGNAVAASAAFDVREVRVSRGRVSLRDRAVPGVPEFEMTSMEAQLRRSAKGTLVTFEGDALGGPSRNLSGSLEVPADGRDAILEMSAHDVRASRLPEVVQVARGGMPFTAALDGVVSVDVDGLLPRAWPPAPAALEVFVDAEDASVSLAGGYVRKLAGEPLSVELEMRAGAELLQLRRATFESGDASVDISTLVPEDSKAESQPPLRVTSAGLSADLVTRWVPVLAAFAPSGEVVLEGTVESGEGEPAVRMGLVGTELGVRVGRAPAQLGTLTLRFEQDAEGLFSAAVSVDELTSEDLFAHRLAAALRGGSDEPLLVRLDGERGGRGDARLDRLAVDVEIAGEQADVRRLEVAGLGGTLEAQGEVARGVDDVVSVRITPQWDGLDFAGLLRLFGTDVDVQGLFSGDAALSMRQGAEESLLDTLTGVFDVRLANGSVAEVNLARATLANLEVIPGLGEAIARRAEGEAPELVERTSRIDALSAEGAVGDGIVSVENLRLDAPDYSLDASGRVAFDGNVQLAGDLVLGPGATRALASLSSIFRALATEKGALRIPVSIGGSYPELTSAPSPAFVSKSIAGSVGTEATGGAEGFLRRLFGGGGAAPSDAAPE